MVTKILTYYRILEIVYGVATFISSDGLETSSSLDPLRSRVAEKRGSLHCRNWRRRDSSEDLILIVVLELLEVGK